MDRSPAVIRGKKARSGRPKSGKIENRKGSSKRGQKNILKGVINVAEEAVSGENIKQSIKKNLKQGASDTSKDVVKIGVKELKRKLDGSAPSSPSPKIKIKNKKQKRNYNKTQTGSGIGGTIFD